MTLNISEREEYHPGDPCPCGCGASGSKLAFKSGHVARACKCRSCIGRNNRSRGQRTEARRHRSLGGEGPTPRDEHPHTYPLVVTTEDKGGAQVPRNFHSFIDSTWARHAFRQAEKKTPIGNDALPALYIELSPTRAYLVVKVMDKGTNVPESTRAVPEHPEHGQKRNEHASLVDLQDRGNS